MFATNASRFLTSQPSKNRVRLAVSLFYFAHGLGFASWASRIPSIKSALGLSEAQLGTILLMLPIGQLLTMPISGTWVDRYGSHKILPWAALSYAVVLICIGLSGNAWFLGASLFLMGVTGNLCNISVNTQGILTENLYGRSIMSSFHGAWSFAGFAGALIGLLTITFQIDTFGHFIGIFAMLMLNVLVNRKHLIPNQTSKTNQKDKVRFKPDALIVQLGIIGFFSMATEGAMFDWSGVYFSDVVKSPEKLIVLGYAAFMVMMALGRFLGDKVIARFGKQRTLQVSGLLMFSGMMLSVLTPTIWICTIAFMMVGLGVACNVPIVYSVTGKHPRIPAGVALALVSSISFFGFLLGPPLIGYIAEAFNLRYAFAVFSLFGFAMMVMCTRLNVLDEK